MPLRKMPDVSSTTAISSISGLVKTLLSSSSVSEFHFHLAGRRVARVERRKSGFLGSVFDQPPIQQHPKDDDRRWNEKYSPGCVR